MKNVEFKMQNLKWKIQCNAEYAEPLAFKTNCVKKYLYNVETSYPKPHTPSIKHQTPNNKSQTPNAKLLLTAYFVLLTFISFAQTFIATLDRDKIVIGEQVTLTIESSKINTDNSFITEWPQLADTVNNMETVKRSSIDTIIINGLSTYQQTFTITSFDSGKWQLGPFTIFVEDRKTNKKNKLITTPLFLSVLSVDVSNLKDYHGIKDIIDVEVQYNWWIPTGIAAVVLLIALVFYFIIKKMRKPKTIAQPALQGTALERALQKLRHLQEDELNGDDEIKLFHTNMDTVCRQYFYEETGMNAMHITTAELMQRLNVYLQQPDLRKQFQQLMYMNSAVKFAKYFPPKKESMLMLATAANALTEINKFIKKVKENAH